MSVPKELIKDNINRAFIAYSYVHIKLAIKELKRAPNAEAIVLQPYEKEKRFSSSEETVDFYRSLRDGQGIPILFTPQGRRNTKGQFFEYGARLLDVLDIQVSGTQEMVKRNQQQGKWVLQHGDDLYAVDSTRNLLVVQAPIVTLPDKIPVGMAINILRHRGSRVQAVAIPAPKLIDKEYIKVLQSL